VLGEAVFVEVAQDRPDLGNGGGAGEAVDVDEALPPGRRVRRQAV
jgi:hypothetical protein